MTSEDFVKIFYSNRQLGADWESIDELTWMYEEGLLNFITNTVTDHEEFVRRIDKVANPKEGLIKNGENETHMALKSLAADYLVNVLGVLRTDILYEYPLQGFEVDVIDRNLNFPAECGDTNAFKLEKYLSLSSTKKFIILPYPHLEDVKVFIFSALPGFHRYIEHKNKYLSKARASYLRK